MVTWERAQFLGHTGVLLEKPALAVFDDQVASRRIWHVRLKLLLGRQFLVSVRVRVWVGRAVRQVGEQITLVVVKAEAAFLLLQ